MSWSEITYLSLPLVFSHVSPLSWATLSCALEHNWIFAQCGPWKQWRWVHCVAVSCAPPSSGRELPDYSNDPEPGQLCTCNKENTLSRSKYLTHISLKLSDTDHVDLRIHLVLWHKSMKKKSTLSKIIVLCSTNYYGKLAILSFTQCHLPSFKCPGWWCGSLFSLAIDFSDTEG